MDCCREPLLVCAPFYLSLRRAPGLVLAVTACWWIERLPCCCIYLILSKEIEIEIVVKLPLLVALIYRSMHVEDLYHVIIII